MGVLEGATEIGKSRRPEEIALPGHTERNFGTVSYIEQRIIL